MYTYLVGNKRIDVAMIVAKQHRLGDSASGVAAAADGRRPVDGVAGCADVSHRDLLSTRNRNYRIQYVLADKQSPPYHQRWLYHLRVKINIGGHALNHLVF